LKVAHHDCAERALTAFKTGSADFADYFLSYINIELGCTSTATFDLKALTSPNFTSVP